MADGALHGALDVIRSVRDGATDNHGRVVVADGDLLLIDGWVLVGGAPVAEVELQADGAHAARLVTGYARDDVRAVHGEGAHRSGFRGAFPVAALSVGSHLLEIRVGPERIVCFRQTPLLIADLGAPAERADGLAIAGGVTGGGAYAIGTMLQVEVRADGASDDEPFDAGLVVDGRWFVQGRRRDEVSFDVLLPTEQLGLGPHTLLACAFSAERRREEAAPPLRFVVDDGGW